MRFWSTSLRNKECLERFTSLMVIVKDWFIDFGVFEESRKSSVIFYQFFLSKYALSCSINLISSFFFALKISNQSSFTKEMTSPALFSLAYYNCMNGSPVGHMEHLIFLLLYLPLCVLQVLKYTAGC